MDLLGGVGFIADIDTNPLSNSRSQHRPGELTVVRSGYYLSALLRVIRRQLNLTLADMQHVNISFPGHGHRKRAQGYKPRQLKEGPASEQAG
jgi:hypothetical protein